MKLAVSDIDGTLTKTSAVDEECYLQAFIDVLGIKSVDSNWSNYEHVTDLGVMNNVFTTRFGRPPKTVEISKFIEQFVALLEERNRLNNGAFEEIPGAVSFLASFGQRSDWRTAIATGGWERSARLKLRTAGIDVGETPTAFAEDGPSRESIVRTAIDRASSIYKHRAFQKVVSIGDAVWDVHTANRLDLPFVGVGYDDRAARLRQFGASHVILNFLDQQKCLRSFENAVVPRGPANTRLNLAV